MSEQVGNKQIIQGEDIVVTVDGKPTLHATNHSLKVDLEVKDIRTKDTNGKEKYPGDISWSVHPLQVKCGGGAQGRSQRSPYEELHRDGIHHLLLPRHSGWRQRHLQLYHHRKRQSHPG